MRLIHWSICTESPMRLVYFNIVGCYILLKALSVLGQRDGILMTLKENTHKRCKVGENFHDTLSFVFISLSPSTWKCQLYYTQRFMTYMSYLVYDIFKRSIMHRTIKLHSSKHMYELLEVIYKNSGKLQSLINSFVTNNTFLVYSAVIWDQHNSLTQIFHLLFSSIENFLVLSLGRKTKIQELKGTI